MVVKVAVVAVVAMVAVAAVVAVVVKVARVLHRWLVEVELRSVRICDYSCFVFACACLRIGINAATRRR